MFFIELRSGIKILVYEFQVAIHFEFPLGAKSDFSKGKSADIPTRVPKIGSNALNTPCALALSRQLGERQK
jgi:hypothetical protein